MAGEGAVLDRRSWDGLVMKFLDMAMVAGLHRHRSKRAEPFPSWLREQR